MPLSVHAANAFTVPFRIQTQIKKTSMPLLIPRLLKDFGLYAQGKLTPRNIIIKTPCSEDISGELYRDAENIRMS